MLLLSPSVRSQDGVSGETNVWGVFSSLVAHETRITDDGTWGGFCAISGLGRQGQSQCSSSSSMIPARDLLPNDTSRVENQSSAFRGPEHQLLGGTEHPRGAQSYTIRGIKPQE